jgi:hypothetical protein
MAFAAFLIQSAAGDAAARVSGLRLFDGQPRILLVHDFSASFQWPELLQRKLDARFIGNNPLKVMKAVNGETPIARWLDLSNGQPLPLWTEIVTPRFETAGETPIVVLAQQSLQWVFGDRKAGIRSEHDDARIRQGANAIDRYVRLLKGEGADLIFIGMRFHGVPMEPEVGNERFALKAYLDRGEENVVEGPDAWKLSKTLHPKDFSGNRLHPGPEWNEALAQAWFETLLRFDGLEAPVRTRSSAPISVRVRVKEGDSAENFEKLEGESEPIQSRVLSRELQRK